MAGVFLQNQPQVQANREYVLEDPLAPLRLPPLAQISEFWRRYDRLADIHDKKLTSNLNGNLDVLLIFAALFSAINTTFISITMPNLSPNPSDETNNLLRLLVMKADNNTLTPADLALPFSADSNSVIVNCLLYASLSCSLLAAAGAMMAKEWLQSFDRTGQTGPPEEQALFRQRKFNGVLKWHLEAVIKFLPNLLILSVILFFLGVCLFLFPINRAVAGTVTAFSGIGVVFSGIAIVAGAISPVCPYQSAASSALRRGCWGLVQSWRAVGRTIIQPAIGGMLEVVRKWCTTTRRWINDLTDSETLVAARARMWRYRSSRSDDSGGQESLAQEPARSMQAISSYSRSNIDQIPEVSSTNDLGSDQAGSDPNSSTAAQPVCLCGGIFGVIESLKQRLESLSRPVFLSTLCQGTATASAKVSDDQVLTVQAARWLLDTTSNRGDQISTVQLICSLDRDACANVFEDSNSWKRLLNLTFGAFGMWDSELNRENQEVAELFGLALCRVLLQCPQEDQKWKDITDGSFQAPSRFVQAFSLALKLVSVQYQSSTSNDDHRILHIAVIIAASKTVTNFKEYQWLKLSRLLESDTHSESATALFRVWARVAWLMGTLSTSPNIFISSGGTIELGNNQQDLARDLSLTLGLSLKCFQLVQGDLSLEIDTAQGYILCLQKARELCQETPDTRRQILGGLGELICSYIDPLTASDSADIRLVRLSVEALLTLNTFLSHPSSSAPPRTSRDNLISSAALINNVVDVLLDDLTSLMGQGEVWKSRARTFKASVIRILLWIWRNHPDRDPDYYWQCHELFISSCRLWTPLEKEVDLCKTWNFDSGEKPLTADDLKGVIECAEWVLSGTLFTVLGFDGNSQPIRIETSACIIRSADVGINRLYAHFGRHAEWQYHLYDFYEDSVSCSRSIHREDGML